MRLIALAAFLLVLGSVDARAQCFQDMGRQKADAFGVSQQLAALKKQLGSSKCDAYGLSWSESRKDGKVDKGVLVFNAKTGELIRTRYVTKTKKRQLEAESWSGVSMKALANNAPRGGIDQKHHVRISPGTSMVVSDSTARFMRKSNLSNFLRGSLLTAGRSEQAKAKESAIAGSSGPASSQQAGPRDVDTVAALPSVPGKIGSKASAKLMACLEKIAAVDGVPSDDARASEPACEEELQMAEGLYDLRTAKMARLDDLLEIHLTGRLSSCLVKITKLGGLPGEEAKATGPACQAKLKQVLAQANDAQIYAMLETERDHNERLDLIWKMPNHAARERQLEREERRHKVELGYIESCVKEIIDLGAKPSDGAINEWNTCQREKFAARAQARQRTDEIERQIIATRDPRERRKLALEIPLQDMKQYWLNHIEREEHLTAKSASPRR